jgi:hypothetical protein
MVRLFVSFKACDRRIGPVQSLHKYTLTKRKKIVCTCREEGPTPWSALVPTFHVELKMFNRRSNLWQQELEPHVT